MFGYASSHHMIIIYLSTESTVFHSMSISIRNEILPRLGQCVVSLRDTFQGLQKKCSWKDGRTAGRPMVLSMLWQLCPTKRYKKGISSHKD